VSAVARSRRSDFRARFAHESRLKRQRRDRINEQLADGRYAGADDARSKGHGNAGAHST
jgi:hypothetical protein